MDVNKLETARGLIDTAAFLAVSIEDVEQIINEAGYTEIYQNGQHQKGQKISAAVQTYNGLVAKYTTIITNLLKIVPKAQPKPKQKSEVEIEAERERAESQARFRRQQERDKAISDAFMDAYKGKPATVEAFKEFKAEWERQHAGEYEVM